MTETMRRSICLCTAILAIALHTSAMAEPVATIAIADDTQLLKNITTPDGTQPIHWRVTWHAEPATKAIVSWNTIEPGKTHQLHLRSKDGEDKRTIDCGRSGKFSGGPKSLYYHHARAADLKPETRYYVQCESDGKKSPLMWFLTAPAENKSVRLLFGGDSRSGHADRRKVNRRMARLLDEMPEILTALWCTKTIPKRSNTNNSDPS